MLRMTHADASVAESTPCSRKNDATVSNAATGCAKTTSLYKDEPFWSAGATTESPNGTTTSNAKRTTLWINSVGVESAVASRRTISQTVKPPAALRLAKVDGISNRI